MSSTAEWRKLADDPFNGKHGSVSLTPVLGALRAACDRVDELESDQLDASQVGAQLMLRLGEHIEARQKAEARVAEIESHRAAAQHASINDCERAEKAEARVAELEASISAGSRRTLLERAEVAEARVREIERLREGLMKAAVDSPAIRELRERAEKAEAELARVTAEAAALREAMTKMIASAHPHPKEHPTMTTAWMLAKIALSSTSAGAGLLKRLEAAERVCESAGVFLTCRDPIERHAYEEGLGDCWEAWKRARGEAK